MVHTRREEFSVQLHRFSIFILFFRPLFCCSTLCVVTSSSTPTKISLREVRSIIHLWFPSNVFRPSSELERGKSPKRIREEFTKSQSQCVWRREISKNQRMNFSSFFILFFPFFSSLYLFSPFILACIFFTMNQQWTTQHRTRRGRAAARDERRE